MLAKLYATISSTVSGVPRGVHKARKCQQIWQHYQTTDKNQQGYPEVPHVHHFRSTVLCTVLTANKYGSFSFGNCQVLDHIRDFDIEIRRGQRGRRIHTAWARAKGWIIVHSCCWRRGCHCSRRRRCWRRGCHCSRRRCWRWGCHCSRRRCWRWGCHCNRRRRCWRRGCHCNRRRRCWWWWLWSYGWCGCCSLNRHNFYFTGDPIFFLV